jgi:ribosomal protein L44E
VVSRWEDAIPEDEGRPRRRYYRLTRGGADQARFALARTATSVLPVPKRVKCERCAAAARREAAR